MKKTTTTAAIAALVLNAAVALAADPICGDVNMSGSVTTGDALAVLRRSVDQPIVLQCPPLATPPDTGETTSYGSGSDGDLESGVARSFTDNGDGTITDHATGLMWEKKSDHGDIHSFINEYSWSTGTNNMDGTIATVFLATLNAGGGFAGHTDWRVPNLNELETLRNIGAVIPATFSAFNTACAPGCTATTCSCTESTLYWSSSTYQANPAFAWSVGFDGGYTNFDGKTSSRPVRAVRTGS